MGYHEGIAHARFRIIRIQIAAALYAIAAAVTISGSVSAFGQANGLAGKWHVSLKASCTVSSRNPHACQELATMGLHVYALKATRLTYRGVDHLVMNARGQFSERGSATFVGSSPGATVPSSCDPNILESQLFRKKCHVTWTGTGHVHKGGTVMPDLFTDTGKLIFHGKSVTYDQTYKGIGDSLIPAVPGTYGTQKYLGMVGEAAFMRGITISLTVTHSTS